MGEQALETEDQQDLVLVYRSKLGKHPRKLRMRYIVPYRIFKDLGQGTF